MKTIITNILAAACMFCLVMACGTPKSAVTSSADFTPSLFLQQVVAPTMPDALTASLKFSLNIGSRDVSVGGQLHMKHDDVIRIQLMALGIVEAGRLEFTPDYVLLMDRINKQYVMADYDQLDFLRQSGITFYTLQALFWNQLFEPGQQEPRISDFEAQRIGNIVSIRLPEAVKMLNYSWQADVATARIQNARVDHSEAQLQWNYADFQKVGSFVFPSDMRVSVSGHERSLKVGLQLSALSSDDDWESRTTISSKYKKVDIDDILDRLMSL